jgi:hypothetical protein
LVGCGVRVSQSLADRCADIAQAAMLCRGRTKELV